MVRQRLYGILAGYEDGNDHTTLCGEPVFKIVSGRAPNEGHLATGRTCLIKVAGEVFSSTRRIVIRIPTYWPHLRWFRDVWRRLTELRRRAQVQT